jgi:hypothetical protein
MENDELDTDIMNIRAHEHFMFNDHVAGTITIFVLPEKKEITFPKEHLLQIPTIEERRAFIAAKIVEALECPVATT